MKSDIALLVIDVQIGMFLEQDPVHDGEGLLWRISGLIKKAKACDTMIYYGRSLTSGMLRISNFA